jgi:hypothetical protein
VEDVQSVLAALWPWSLIAFLACTLFGWLAGYFMTDLIFMLSTGFFLLSDILLPMLAVLSAKAKEINCI